MGVALAAGASAGCGPPQPQAPVAQANRVASALAGISAACGESYQQRALEPRAVEPGVLETAASERAHELADVYRLDPQWIYNGDTLRQIVAVAVRDLRECDLPRAAGVLVSATR
ncbi:MAG TPA: hypothetical protein VH137_03465 [Gemmatimonadales bacterium]|jgi:hypothetical protein|nr:hypothetical protein [Gemmatimonadales bacterium]